ncbi:transcriptional regulator [Agrobacterium larrymoorei]|uniref:DNA-binding transcriptional regulator YiaG n=1 Tax=Agrobacterium larrymoorei TaxID=160699 RepID=A0ABU0UDM1_9HYPH|nr:transcriptional regulator [Agrobacterium larrymoorei]MDQ1183036.1 DNA-binding transcriptional regulator YiaG [Agrobacterium larrymoorei]
MERRTNHRALTDNDTLGGRISLARDASALSLVTAAKMVGVDSEVWSAWENDRSEPAHAYMETIAASLHVSGTWLATGFGPGPRWPSDEALF